MMFLPSEFGATFSPCSHHCCHRRPKRMNSDFTAMFMDDPFSRVWAHQVPRMCRSNRQPHSLRQITVNDIIQRVGRLIGEETVAQKTELQKETRTKVDGESSTQDTSKHITFPDLIQSITESIMARHPVKPTEGDGPTENTTATTEQESRLPTFKDWIRKVSRAMEQEFDSTCCHDVKGSDETTTDRTVSIRKDSDEFRVEIKTGDFKPEEIEVKVKDGYLTVYAHREEKSEENGVTRSHSQKLERMVKLPSSIDPDDVRAEMSRGLLTLLAPKEAAQRGPTERIVAIEKPYPETTQEPAPAEKTAAENHTEE